jgi:acetyl-CoA acyltransferase
VSEDIWILGIQMTKFGKHPDKDSIDLASEAALGALSDAGLTINDVGMMTVGNLWAANMGTGQRLQKQIGQTGIPVYNIANACATGAAAVRVAVMALKAGECDVAMAVGVEKLAGAGLLTGANRKPDAKVWSRRGRFGIVSSMDGLVGTDTQPGTFSLCSMAYGHRYGAVDWNVFAGIAEKNHFHSTLNPLAAYQKPMPIEAIRNEPMISYPNTRAMCSANCDGSAAAVLVTDSKLKTLSLEQRRRAVKISASVLTTDPWTEGCQVQPDINTLSRNAAVLAYEQAGVGPEDLDLVELHDCFASAELLHYDNLMLCEEGGAVDLFKSGATWRDGRLPVNVSGGLLSKGHPIAATGIANLYELAVHLRGEGGSRQIEGAKIGLAHVIGIGSACGVHILERAAA